MITQEVHKKNPNLKITNIRSNTALEWNGETYDAVPQNEAVESCLNKMTNRLGEVVEKRTLYRIPVTEMESWADNIDDDDPEFPERRKKGLESIRHGLYTPS